MTIDVQKLRERAAKAAATPGVLTAGEDEHSSTALFRQHRRSLERVAVFFGNGKDALAKYIAIATPDVVVALLDERDAAIRERDGACEDLHLFIEQEEMRSEQVASLRAQLASARTAARALADRIDDMGMAMDDSDPKQLATAAPVGEAEAELFLALGIYEEERARKHATLSKASSNG